MSFPKFLIRGCLCLSVWVGSSELELAQRYFQARQAQKSAEPLALQSGSISRDSARWPAVGSAWRMGVRLARPAFGGPRVSKEREFSPDLRVTYQVIGREAGPVYRWMVQLTSESWPTGMSWEQEVLPEHSQVRIRPCMERYCGPWRDMKPDAAVATAGHRDLVLGVQAHLFLSSESLAALSQGQGERWSSEDFFGRQQGWEWPSDKPWPIRLWNAQSEVRWIGEVSE